MQACATNRDKHSTQSAAFQSALSWAFFGQELRDKVTKAVQSVAVFATEWGTCDADGDGTLNFQEAKIWFPGSGSGWLLGLHVVNGMTQCKSKLLQQEMGWHREHRVIEYHEIS